MSTVLTRWKARLKVREALLRAARQRLSFREKKYWFYRHDSKRSAAERGRLTDKWDKLVDEARADVRKRTKQVDEAKRVIARHTSRKRLTATVTFDGVPVFRGLAYTLQDARDHGWEGRLNSADRRKGIAERYDKKSQVALYLGWIARLVGFRPANRPGRSTHELRSDAVAYRGPIGRPLSWWQLGMDVSNALQLRVVLNRLGYSSFRPYPAGSEAHHVNLKKSPTANLRKRHRA